MLISERLAQARRIRLVMNDCPREFKHSDSQNDLQNTKSLKISPNSKYACDQRARTENKRMYAKAYREAERSFQDKFERIGQDKLDAALKILKGK